MENFSDDIEEIIRKKDEELGGDSEEITEQGIEKEEIDENKATDQEIESEEDGKTDDGDTDTSAESIVKIEIDGVNYNISSQEQLIELARAGLANRPKEKDSRVDLIKQENLKEEDLATLLDLSRGNKAAAKKILEEKGIDPLELLDEELQYTREVQVEEVSDLDKVANTILADEEWTTNYRETISHIPCTDFKKNIETNPAALSFFAQQVKTGLAEEIIPEATMMSITNKISFADAYVTVGKRIEANKNRGDQINEKRKVMSGAKSGSSGSRGEVNAWSMSQKDFDDLMGNDIIG